MLAERILPIGLLLTFALQCVWFMRTQSLTFDEPVHIAEGLDAWRHGRFEQYNDHPPLARLLCSLPLRSQKWQIEVEQLPDSFQIQGVSPDPVAMAWRARAMILPLGVLLGGLIWVEARRYVSLVGANFTLALFAFTPSLITHFSLATTDGAATLLIFATAIQIEHWRHNPSWKQTTISGLLLGLLLLAKFSTLPMFFLACACLLVGGRPLIRPWTWNWSKCGAAVAMAVLVVWTGYFFHVSRLTIRGGVLTVSHPHWSSSLVKPSRTKLNISLPVPAGEYVAGLRDLAFHNAHGQRAFFLGEVSATGGWKSYYPVAILLKWPSLLVGSGLLGLGLCLLHKRPVARRFWFLFWFPGLYFFLAIFSHFNIGERHILPLYPFALLLAAVAGDWIVERPWGPLFVGVVLLLNASDVLRYAPGYLSYMNILVNPMRSNRLLSDSNVDWGQGLMAVREYQKQHPGEPVSLAYFGSVDPKLYGITASQLQENQRTSGIIIIGATQLSGQYLRDPTAYHWLLEYEPTRVLDHCMYVFEVR